MKPTALETLPGRRTRKTLMLVCVAGSLAGSIRALILSQPISLACFVISGLLALCVLIRSSKTFATFTAWFNFYRKGHIMVLHLGRWESFWRAAGWVWRNK